jgi:hypothetical protein
MALMKNPRSLWDKIRFCVAAWTSCNWHQEQLKRRNALWKKHVSRISRHLPCYKSSKFNGIVIMKTHLRMMRFLMTAGSNKPSDATSSVVACGTMQRSVPWSVALRHIFIIPLNKVWPGIPHEDQFHLVLVLNSMHFKWLEPRFLP